jgi:excisionase family DNA binding protein
MLWVSFVSMTTDVRDLQLLTVRETAALLRQSERSIRRKIHAGEIPALRLSEFGPLRIDRRELEAWLFSSGGAFLSSAALPAERSAPDSGQSTVRAHGGREKDA